MYCKLLFKKGQLKMNMQRVDVHKVIKEVAENILLQISSKQENFYYFWILNRILSMLT